MQPLKYAYRWMEVYGTSSSLFPYLLRLLLLFLLLSILMTIKLAICCKRMRTFSMRKFQRSFLIKDSPHFCTKIRTHLLTSVRMCIWWHISRAVTGCSVIAPVILPGLHTLLLLHARVAPSIVARRPCGHWWRRWREIGLRWCYHLNDNCLNKFSLCFYFY